MPVKNIRHYRAREEDDEKFEAFMEKRDIASTAEFMHLVAEHLDILEAAFNSSQIATISRVARTAQPYCKME